MIWNCGPIIYFLGTKDDWDFRISDLVKNPDGIDINFNPCGEFRWSPESPVSQIHSPHLHAGAPVIFSDLLRSVKMLWREWSWGKQPEATAPIYSY